MKYVHRELNVLNSVCKGLSVLDSVHMCVTVLYILCIGWPSNQRAQVYYTQETKYTGMCILQTQYTWLCTQ